MEILTQTENGGEVDSGLLAHAYPTSRPVSTRPAHRSAACACASQDGNTRRNRSAGRSVQPKARGESGSEIHGDFHSHPAGQIRSYLLGAWPQGGRYDGGVHRQVDGPTAPPFQRGTPRMPQTSGLQPILFLRILRFRLKAVSQRSVPEGSFPALFCPGVLVGPQESIGMVGLAEESAMWASAIRGLLA
jgi:hypothetical protein